MIRAIGVVSSDLIPHPIWTEVVERSLALAAELDVVICPEIHAPTPIRHEVVEEYIETAQPVGSGHVAKAASVQVSPATVRNDMATLEQDGYLFQPHTSAGRIPTEKGYRFFVDRQQGC